VKLPFYTVDAFTNNTFQGAPILVFPDADALSEATMHTLTQEFGFPDTVFVTKPESARNAAKFRLFKPTGQTQFEGHATVGAAYAWLHHKPTLAAELPYQLTIEEDVGPIDIRFSRASNGEIITEFIVSAEAKFDTYVPSTEDMAKILSLDPEHLQGQQLSPMVTICERAYLIVPVSNSDALRQARFSSAKWRQCTTTSTMPREIFAYAPSGDSKSTRYVARLLGESIGPDEDPPIGSAMTAFASYLLQSDANTASFVVERGRGHQRLSTINVHIDQLNKGTTTIRVGGSVTLVSEGNIQMTNSGRDAA